MRELVEQNFKTSDLEKMRKDTLTLLRAAEKESSLKEALHVRDAIRKFQKYLEILFYKKMAPLISDKYAEKKFKEMTWKFYIEMNLPLYPEDSKTISADEHYKRWQDKKRRWLASARKTAREAWAAISEFFLDGKEFKDIEDTFQDTTEIEGFRVVFKNKPTPKEIQVINESLKIAKSKLGQVFPAALKRKPIITFQREGLDLGGEYLRFERNVVANLDMYSSNPARGAQIIVHELAHDIYAEYLSERSKDYWQTAIVGDYGDVYLSDIVKNWPDEMADKSLYRLGEYLASKNPIQALQIQMLTNFGIHLDYRTRQDAIEDMQNNGNRKFVLPKSPITAYASKNPEEAFCEAFSFYTVYGPRAVLPGVRLWLRTIMPAAKIESKSPGSNLLVEVKLSYKDVLKWKKDFDQLLLAFRSQDYRDIRSAIKGFQQIDKSFRMYFKNLKNYVQRDFFTIIDRNAKTIEGVPKAKQPMRTKVALAFEALLDAYWELESNSNPMHYDPDGPHAQTYSDVDQRIDWYVNGRWKDTTKNSKDIALENAADKFFSQLREMIKFLSSDQKEYDSEVYYPERVGFMGFSFINNIDYDEDDLKKMFTNMAPYLKIMKRFMPEVFYGPVFMEPRTANQKNLKVGKMTINAAGTYNPSGDKVTLYADDVQSWMTAATAVLVHELAHRYYFKFLKSEDRRRWEDFFYRLKTQSASDYGDQNPEEDFAEAILHYVYSKGVMAKKDVRDRVEALLKRTYRESKMFGRDEVFHVNALLNWIK